MLDCIHHAYTVLFIVMFLCCAGESYAGIYVPMLTKEVVKGNKLRAKPHIHIKVRG